MPCHAIQLQRLYEKLTPEVLRATALRMCQVSGQQCKVGKRWQSHIENAILRCTHTLAWLVQTLSQYGTTCRSAYKQQTTSATEVVCVPLDAGPGSCRSVMPWCLMRADADRVFKTLSLGEPHSLFTSGLCRHYGNANAMMSPLSRSASQWLRKGFSRQKSTEYVAE